jgi:hypothetical protein
MNKKKKVVQEDAAIVVMIFVLRGAYDPIAQSICSLTANLIA